MSVQSHGRAGLRPKQRQLPAGRMTGLGIGVAHDGPAPTVGFLSAALETAHPAGRRSPG